MVQQDIDSLTNTCIAWLRENGYSETRIRDYLLLWKNGIVKFMEKHAISVYSPTIGDDFIDSPLPFNSPTYRRAVRRSVAVLSDFLATARLAIGLSGVSIMNSRVR